MTDELSVISAPDGNKRKNRVRHLLELAALRHYLPSQERVKCTVDFGCGLGRFFPWLLQYTDTLWGLEITPGMLERAAENHGSNPRVRLRLFDGSRLPPEVGAPERVFCSAVLREVFYRHRDVYREIANDWYKRLVPGGQVIQLEMFVEDDQPESLTHDFVDCGFRLDLVASVLRHDSKNISRAAKRLGFPLLPAFYIRRELREAASYRGKEPTTYLYVYHKPATERGQMAESPTG